MIVFFNSLINKKLKRKNCIIYKRKFVYTIYNAIQKFGVSTFFLIFFLNLLFRRYKKS